MKRTPRAQKYLRDPPDEIDEALKSATSKLVTDVGEEKCW